jgi:hypothetical protein
MKTAEAPLVAPLDEHNPTLVRNVHPVVHVPWCSLDPLTA